MRGGRPVVMETVCCSSESESGARTHGGLRPAAGVSVTALHHLAVDMTSQRDVIDFKAMEAEFRAAVESDQKHRRENETKLRAVGQGVSYGQFRDLVLTCHLKPLHHSDKHGAPRKQPWNPVAHGNQ